MAYSKNPFLPGARRDAVNLVRLKGFTVRKAAERIGVSSGTISKWLKKAPEDTRRGILTLSSAPHVHPNQISQEIEDRIVAERKKHKRCGKVIWETLKRENIMVSLNTIQRILDRHGLLKKQSPWKKRHISMERPLALIPGDLLELDTIHEVPKIGSRFYIYTMIDVASRSAFAWVARKISAGISLIFAKRAQIYLPFPFQMLQSDNGPEFSSWFTSHVMIPHRHIRVGKPNDDAHIERFNRTIQDECFAELPRNPEAYAKALPEYLRYYNSERLHLGIECMTPEEKVAKLFPRSWG